MSDWRNVDFVRQGWQCPICGAVYSPLMMACVNCTGWQVSNTLVDNKTVIDWGHRDSSTKPEEQHDRR